MRDTHRFQTLNIALLPILGSAAKYSAEWLPIIMRNRGQRLAEVGSANLCVNPFSLFSPLRISQHFLQRENANNTNAK